jgi:hypothetical protein
MASVAFSLNEPVHAHRKLVDFVAIGKGMVLLQNSLLGGSEEDLLEKGHQFRIGYLRMLL